MSVLALSTACTAPGTFVELTFSGALPSEARKIVLNLQLGGTGEDVTITKLPAQFPSTAVLQIENGEGALTIVGQLQTESGSALSTTGMQTVTVIRDKSVKTTLVFPGQMMNGDMAAPDLTGQPAPDLHVPSDLPVPADLAPPADLTPVPVTFVVTKDALDGATGVLLYEATACEPTCSNSVLTSTSVTLTATPDSGFGWEGWPAGLGGTCTGLTSPCTMPVVGAQSITIRFSPVNRIFVTNRQYRGDRIAFDDVPGGVLDFDAECQRHALALALPGSTKYKAWYSTPSRNAIDELLTPDALPSRGWVRLDGLPFSDTLTDLTSRRNFYPVLYVGKDDGTFQSAFGLIAEGKIAYWTGTNLSGQVAGNNCNGFTGTTTFTSTRGSPVAGGNSWIDRNQGISCDPTIGLPILCMGTAYRAGVAAPKQTGKLVFVSGAVAAIDQGVTAFDQLCWDDALSGGLCADNTSACKFKAAVATTTSTARDRFATDSASQYVRLDGTIVAATQLDLFTQKWQAPISVNASGGYALHVQVITGVKSSGATLSDQGDTPSTCSDWSSTGGKMRVGDSHFMNVEAVNDEQINCSSIYTTDMGPATKSVRVYCIEN